MSEQTLPVSGAASADTDTEVPKRRSGIVLATLLTCQLMLILDMTVMNVALPHIRADLDFSATGLSWVLNSYTLAFGGLLLLGGRAGDLFGRRRLFIGGITLFTVASLAGGLADSAAWLIVARVVQGAGAAAAGPNTLALITTTFTEQRARIRALSLFSVMSSAGFAIGLVIGGLLTEWMSWRAVLFINVPFGAVIAILAIRHLRESERRSTRLDLPGAATATAGVVGIVYGLIRAEAEGWGDAFTVASLTGGVLLLIVFLTLESRTEQPLMPLRLFTDRNRATAYFVFFLIPAAGFAMFFFLTQYLQDVHGMSALATGFAFLPMAVGLFAMTRLMPRLIPRYGPRPLTMTGTAMVAAGLALLSQLTTGTGYFPWVLAAVILVGVGMGLGAAPLNVVIMSGVPAQETGVAGGVLQTMQQAGGTVGLAVMVTVFGSATRDAASDGHSAEQVLVTGMTTAFTCAVFVAALAFVATLVFRRVEK